MSNDDSKKSTLLEIKISLIKEKVRFSLLSFFLDILVLLYVSNMSHGEMTFRHW